MSRVKKITKMFDESNGQYDYPDVSMLKDEEIDEIIEHYNDFDMNDRPDFGRFYSKLSVTLVSMEKIRTDARPETRDFA